MRGENNADTMDNVSISGAVSNPSEWEITFEQENNLMKTSNHVFVTLATGAMCLCFAANTQAASVILNEYNAVSSSKYLDGDTYGESSKSDVRLGRIEGNGGNWIELAVVGDGTDGSTVDMRNWTLDWVEDGTDVGTINLSNDSFWSNVRAGTLITIGELQTLTAELGGTVVNGSNVGIDFASGDHWAHVWSFDTQYISSTITNVSGDGSGNFSVGKDNWQLTIKDNSASIVFGPEGEGISDGGVNSKEVYKLEGDVSTSIVAGSAPYSDGTSSSFGAPNVWSGGSSQQDFASFGVAVPEPTSLLLLSCMVTVMLANRRRV